MAAIKMIVTQGNQGFVVLLDGDHLKSCKLNPDPNSGEMNCCDMVKGKACNYQAISREKAVAIARDAKKILLGLATPVFSKLFVADFAKFRRGEGDLTREDAIRLLSPVQVQCSPTDSILTMTADQLKTYEDPQKCPDLRAQHNGSSLSGEYQIEFGWKIASEYSFVQFLGFANDPNLIDVIMRNPADPYGPKLVSIDTSNGILKPKSGQGEATPQGQPRELTPEEAQELNDKFSSVHGGGCGAHLGGKP